MADWLGEEHMIETDVQPKGGVPDCQSIKRGKRGSVEEVIAMW